MVDTVCCPEIYGYWDATRLTRPQNIDRRSPEGPIQEPLKMLICPGWSTIPYDVWYDPIYS